LGLWQKAQEGKRKEGGVLGEKKRYLDFIAFRKKGVPLSSGKMVRKKTRRLPAGEKKGEVIYVRR